MTQEEQIVDCENRLLNALKQGDIDTLEELLHDNLIFNIPTGQTITKEMDIENYRSRIMTVYTVEVSDRIISPVNEDICNVAVTIYLQATYSDQMIDGRFRYLRVWKRTNNAWKVIAGSGIQI